MMKCVLFAALVYPCVGIAMGEEKPSEKLMMRRMYQKAKTSEALLEMTDHVFLKTIGTCAIMGNREFEFQDDYCGAAPQKFKIHDMLKAFQTEQSYWAQEGAENPWWAVDTNFPKGSLTEYPVERQLSFYQHGVATLKEILPKAQALGLLKKDWIAGATALDFGCGLGRMANALASAGFKKVKCVDQAQSMLDAGKDSLAKLAGQGVVAADVSNRLEFVQSAPDLLCVQPPSSVDFVHSVITLQHMKPMLQVAYIEQFCDVLRSGGKGYFQIPTTSGSWKQPLDMHCNLTNDKKQMMMHYTPQDEVERHLTSRGCKVVSAIEHSMIPRKAGKSMLFIFEKP